ncbi:hypothetical protein BH11BAC4_BH11BAC4_07130 [soil metagenome]
MIKIIDISFYGSNNCSSLLHLVKEHEPALAYVDHIKAYSTIQVIKHLDYEGTQLINGVKYTGFKSNNNFWHIPIKTIKYIKEENEDIIIVQGLIFPLQLICLRRALGNKKIILVQHHGESPFSGIKKWLQQKADRSVNGYLFTSIGNAQQWIGANIIANKEKCHELLEASTNFKKLDKPFAKKELQLNGGLNFLWVGRLNAGKDPFTVINAFKKFSADEPTAMLYMIFQSEELLPRMKRQIEGNPSLLSKIRLIGKVPYADMERWYNAADFYISGSHYEGSGYALLEAMACGCIPIVTNIPSFKKISGNGRHAVLYQAGSAADLLLKLQGLKNMDQTSMRESVLKYFQQQLSFSSISAELYSICKKLYDK